MLQRATTFVNNYLFPLLFAVIIFFLFWLLSIVLCRKIMPWLEKVRKKKRQSAFIPWLQGFTQPLSTYLKLAGLCVALLFFFSARPSPGPAWLNTVANHAPQVLYRVLRIGGIVAVAWGLIASNNVAELFMRGAKLHPEAHISKSVARFFSAIFNVVVLAFSVVMIITELGYDVSALITGLGLGGLTVALAAKDSAANFFGGLVLVTERPFEIGDWITFDEVEGSVEDINIRSTKIRTGPGSLTVVPNATLSNANITNWSGGMKKRRASYSLTLPFATHEVALKEFADSVRTMLESDPDIKADSVLVRFSEFGTSGYGIQVTFDTTMPGYGDFMRVKERTNYAIIELAAKMGVRFAYPTQTVEVTQETGRPPQ